MANYNLAFGGDSTWNDNYAMYPQNAYVPGFPEYGASRTVLKPDARDATGGAYASNRIFSFGDPQHQVALDDVSKDFVAGDAFLTHIIPGQSIPNYFHFNVHAGLEGASGTVRLIGEAVTSEDDGEGGTTPVNSIELGTIDFEADGDGVFAINDVYVPANANYAIEITLDSWPEPDEEDTATDPCGIYGDCAVPPKLCFTTTLFYLNPGIENYCEGACYTT